MTYERTASYDDVKLTWEVQSRSGGRVVDLTVHGRLMMRRDMALGGRDWLPLLKRAYDRFEDEVKSLCDDVVHEARAKNPEAEVVGVTYRDYNSWEAANGAIIFWSSPSVEFDVPVQVQV